MAVIKNLPGTKSLIKQLEYLEQEGKTLEELKVGINCTKDNVLKEFYIVKEMHNKNRGKEYYHLVQAFSPEDDISPMKANEIGVEWIKECIENHQIYIVTHIDKNHIHNHFVINSVNMDNGLKLQISPGKLLSMKKTSNEICRKNNLKIINCENTNRIYKSDKEFYMEKRLSENNMKSWKSILRDVIDYSIVYSDDFNEFKNILIDNFNIEVIEKEEKLLFKDIEVNKLIRDKRLGKEYIKENIINRIK